MTAAGLIMALVVNVTPSGVTGDVRYDDAAKALEASRGVVEKCKLKTEGRYVVELKVLPDGAVTEASGGKECVNKALARARFAGTPGGGTVTAVVEVSKVSGKFQVRVLEPTVAGNSSLKPGEVQRVFDGRQKPLETCYRQATTRNPKVKGGTMVATLSVDSKGVGKIDVTGIDAVVGACASHILRTAKLPALGDGQKATITQRIVFTNGK